MATARERMLELSPLTNTTARLHFLAITQTGGTSGGRADLSILGDSTTSISTADSDSLDLEGGSSTITVSANKKGIKL